MDGVIPLQGLKAKIGPTINGIFLETCFFEGEPTSEIIGSFLGKVGVFIRLADAGAIYLHGYSPDGDTLKLTLDDDLTLLEGTQTVLLDLEELGKSMMIDVSAEPDYRGFIGQTIENIQLIRQTYVSTAINGVVMTTAAQCLVFFCAADEGHVTANGAQALLELDRYHYVLEDF